MVEHLSAYVVPPTAFGHKFVPKGAAANQLVGTPPKLVKPTAQNAVHLAAATVQHQVVSEVRQHLDASSPSMTQRKFFLQHGLDPSAWSMRFRGERHLALTDIALLVRALGPDVIPAGNDWVNAFDLATVGTGHDSGVHQRTPVETLSSTFKDANQRDVPRPLARLRAAIVRITETTGIAPPKRLTLMQGPSFGAAGDSGGSCLLVIAPDRFREMTQDAENLYADHFVVAVTAADSEGRPMTVQVLDADPSAHHGEYQLREATVVWKAGSDSPSLVTAHGGRR